MQEGFEHIRVAIDDGVASIQLDRPQVLNALGTQSLREIIQVVSQLDEDPAVRALVFSGAGERAFCAGADLRETGGLDGDGLRRFILLDFRCKSRVASCRKPTVAAVQGYALGGGLELALACDIRLASTRAVFGFAEVELGTVPGSGGVQLLPRVVGRGVAADLLFTGRRIDAREAYRIGLVNRLIEPDEFPKEVQAYGRELASRNPVAVQGIKAALNHQATIPAQGIEAAYHSLLAQACRVGGEYRNRVGTVLKKPERG